MTSSAHFFSSTYTSPAEFPILEKSILFHGDTVDDRGNSAIAFSGAEFTEKILLKYNFENMRITVGNESISADQCVKLLEPHIINHNVVLEATTLGFAELFCVVRTLISLQVCRFQISYVEPRDYTKPIGSKLFELSELISGYHPIPFSVLDLSSDEVEAGVFFLGYESERLARALEEYQMISNKDIKVVFGVPAYQAGWELNAIVPHLQILNEQRNFVIAYCAANDPGSAFDCLQITRQSLSQNHKMFIAPIGTKPCGIAAAVFASLFPAQVGLIYDHPQKKNRRTMGVNIWHRYAIRIDY